MFWSKRCIYCRSTLYKLSDGMFKCSQCKKKYSPNRINKVITLIDTFCENESALAAAKRLHLSTLSIQSYYNDFRRLCAKISEEEYELLRDKSCEFEEFFYLENSKKHTKESLFESQNFLTFDYEGHIYNVIMPPLKKYKEHFFDESLQKSNYNEFSRFKRNTHLAKISKTTNRLSEFWNFFENAILHYKGVRSDLFPLYLKEMEFKFNHSLEEQKEILQRYYFQGEGE